MKTSNPISSEPALFLQPLPNPCGIIFISFLFIQPLFMQM